MSSRSFNLVRNLHSVLLVSLTATISLFSSAVVVAQSTVAPAAVNFGNVAINTASALHAITFKNTGASAINVTGETVPAGGPYAIDPSSTCLSTGTLQAGKSCTVVVTLTPTTLGAQPAGTLTINSTSSSSPNTVALSGVGVQPAALSAAGLAFFNVVENTTSAPKAINLRNNLLTTAITVSPISVSSPYAISGNTCGASLAANSACVISITLTPNALGAVPAQSLSITTNTANSPLTATLTGNGIAPSTLLPAAVNFGNVTINTTSNLKTATFKNNLATAVTVSSLAVTAGTPYAIDPSSTCLTPAVPAGGSCTVNLTFSPTAVGAAPAGTLTVNTTAPNSPLTVALSGAGQADTVLAPAALAFGNVVINTTSATKTITIKNNQTGTLSFTQAIFNGPFALDTTSVIANECPISGGTLNGTLPGGANCVFGVTFDPTALGATAGGKVTIIDTDPSGPISAALSGIGVAPTTLAPAALAFGNVVEGATSATKNVTLANNLSTALSLTSITVPAPFAATTGANACAIATPVPANGKCIIYVTYSPTGLGAAPASTLTVQDNASAGPQSLSVNLTGNGIAPVTLNPAAAAFGNVIQNVLATKNLTLTNNQSVPLTITSITGLPAAYSINSTNTTCPLSPGTVPAAPVGNTCVISLNLTATALGAQPGTMTIHDNASFVGSVPVALSANAISPVLLAPAAVAFPATLVGQTSAAKAVTLTNNQNIPLNISSAVITGANPSDFEVNSNCPTVPASLPATKNCAFSVKFKPTTSGNRSATLTVSDDAANTPQTVALTGAGNAPVLVAPLIINNYSANVGTTSAFKTITITNQQLATPLHFTSFQLSGDFIQSATTCPIGGAGIGGAGAIASCTIAVQFNPSIGGTRNGQLQIYDDALTSPQVVNLSGTGTAPLTIAPGGLNFAAQQVGTVSPAKLITLTNHEAQSETFTLTPAGDFAANSNCPTGIIAAKSSCSIFVNFTPSSANPSNRNGTLTITHTAANGSPIVAALAGSATANAPPPAVSVVSPGAGAAGTAVNVVITGNGWTHFTNSSVITFTDTQNAAFASDIAVSNVVAVNSNTLKATLTLTPPATAIYGARNITVKTPLVGGGVENASLLQAFIIANPNNQHDITAANPAFGTQGQTLNVELTGSGTSWQQGVTFANFGDGISINSLAIISPTDARANITIKNTTYIGYRTITLVTGGEFDVSVLGPGNNPMFQIGPNNAALQTVSPNVEPQGWPSVSPGPTPGQVTITATGSHFVPNATQVSIGGAIVGDVNVQSSTVAVAQVAIPGGAPLGPQNVTVSTGGEIMSLANAFTITGATPALLSVAPSSAAQGQQNVNVIITGNAYTNFPACSTLNANFTGEVVTNSTVANSANQVTANISVSNNANVGGITASLTCGATLFQFGFTITPSSASIVSVVPNSLPQGGQMTVTVTGQNTHWVQGTTTATFYPVPVPAPSVPEITIIDATHAQLNIAVPTNTPVGSYGFYMATGGEIVSSSINVYANTPTLTMNPANGLVPKAPAVNSFTVNFTGQFTKWTQAGTLPVIAGQGVTLSNFTVLTPVSASATLTIAPGAATGLRLVTFTTGGEIETTYFNVTVTPVGIISISPFHSAPGVNNLNVAIVGLNTHFLSGAPAKVLFGPQITVNSVTVTDDTHLTANISTSYQLNSVLTPTPPGYQSVYVNDAAEQVITGFGIDPPATPVIVSVVPGSAQQGSDNNPVAITGQFTHWVQGQSELILGAGINVANLVITSPTTATATISVSPTAPIGGNSVIMITGSEIDSGVGFSVTPGGAYVASVEPNFTCPSNGTVSNAGFNCTNGGAPTGVPVVAQLQTVTLNAVGVGTHWLQGGTTFSFGPGVNVDKLTITSPTTATVQITVLSSAPVGYATLTAYTDGENALLQQAIDIEEGSPILLAFTPTASQQGTTFNLQLLGRFTHWTQGVTSAAFNQDITVNSLTVNDSENMTANITVSPLAYVDYNYPCGHVITVTTGNEQVSMAIPNPGTFCVSQGAEQINSVSPLQGIQGSTETLTVVGSQTNFVAGETQVTFGDLQIGQVQVADATHLTVPVGIPTTASTGFKTITVSTLGQVATQQYSFTVSPGVATLNEAIPNQAEQGSPLAGQPNPLVIRLLGQYSHFSGQSTATLGAGITVLGVQYISPTEVDATITIDPLSYVGGRTVTVDTPNVPCSDQPPLGTTVNGVSYPGCTPGNPNGFGHEIVTANIFTIVAGPAIIESIKPATGNEGQEVIANITGSGTHWAQNFTQFYIAGGGYDITVNSVVINSPTSATVDLSISPTANPGARSIYMVTNGESLTDSGAFVVTGGIPVISYVSPNSALQGTSGLQVTVVGNAYTQWTPGVSTVSFGPGVTVNSFQVDDASHIEAVISIAANAQVGYRTVVVQTGKQGLTGNFQVTAPAPPPTPYIWYENPSSGIPGQTLTISFSGAYTHWDPGPGGACSQSGTTLTGFNSDVTVNCFQVTSPTSAYANVTISPNATASFSTLSLTTNSANPQEVDYAGFSVVVAQPTLSVVDPNSGIQGATNLTVNIIGQFTAFDNTTTFSFGNSSGITTNGPPTILGPTIATQSINIGILTPAGGYSVVATTPDASAANQRSVSGAGFYVTPSLALISAITPNTSTQGSTISVDVQGQNTHWNGATVFQFGAGIVVTSTQVISATDASLILAIPPLAPEGPTGATATTGGEVARIANGFVVQAGTPLLLSSGPGSLPQQSSAIFTILSQATQWSNANPPLVSFGPGVVVTNVNVTGPTSLTVDGFVQPTTNVGYRNLIVTTGTQVLSLPNAFYVSPGPAVINSVVPNTAGQSVHLPALQINGTNTSWQQGVTQLSFPGAVVNSLKVNSLNSMTADVTISTTATAGQVSLTATTLGEVATGVNVFDITQSQPELLSVVSGSGAQGATETVTVTGALTHFSTANSQASFGAGVTVNSINAVSPTSLKVNITVQPTAFTGLRSVTITTGAEVVTLANSFNVATGPAAIASLSPNSGGQGNSFSIVVTGSQTHFAQGVTTASFSGGATITGVTVTDLLHATVNITIPNNTPLGQYNVYLNTGGESAPILPGFTVVSGSPQISAVNPPTGNQGSSNVNITLTGLYTSFLNGTSVANFGSGVTVNSTMCSSPTTCVANITISPTATLGSRNVSVTTGAQVASLTGGFSVLPGIAALLNANPATGQAGTSGLNIVVNGQFTTFQQGFSSANFGSGVTVNFVTVNTLTQLTANINIAANATVGSRDISVTTNGQTQTLSGGFSVTAGTPVITQIDPNIGNPAQTLNVTLTGQYTNWVTGTTVATFGSGIVVNSTIVSTPTSLVANITIPSGAPLGPADVTTTTNAEVEHAPGGFTVQAAVIPPPSLISLSPGPNAGGVPINTAFTAVFSQPMDRTTLNTGTVEMWLVSNPGGWVPLQGTVSVDVSGRIMTFTPSGLLAVNSQYYMLLTNGIKDATGNTFSQYGYVSFYTVFTAATTPPTVIAANPPANATGIGTNVTPQLEFSVDMDQATQAGMTVSTGGSPIAGTYSWNSEPYCCWGPGTLLTFTPASPLAANTTYTVAWAATLTDTAGNDLTPGSFTFTTGSGADTAYNGSGSDFASGITNVGTNFAPRMNYSKPINPIDINTGTLMLYNADSGKYIQGTVTVAPNGLSAQFTPNVPLLPYTYYAYYQAGGYYDADGNYMYGVTDYFTTGGGSDQTAPTVSSVSPANNATSVPLNSELIVRFSAPLDPNNVSGIVTLTPSGGSAVAGAATLQSDQVTLIFVPTATPSSPGGSLKPGTVYTIQVSGYTDMVGNSGVPFSSTFTTATSVAPLVLSTGLDATGNLITTGGTPDPHWTVTPSGAPASQTAYVVAPGEGGWSPNWSYYGFADGPKSSVITVNPNAAQGSPNSTYSTTFDLTGSSLNNLCLVGAVQGDPYGTLLLNGVPISGINQFYGWEGLTPIGINLPASSLNAGVNTLSFAFASNWDNYEGFRLQAAIQTCGASFVGGLALQSATPANGASGVSTGTNITLTFNNPIDPATVNSTTLPVMVGWNSNQEIAGAYAVTGNQVVFTPDSPFPINTQIWVGACGGPSDLAGDSAGPCYTQLTYFNTNGTATPAGTPFHVIASSPANAAINVGLRAPVAFTFNRSVNLGSVNTSDFAMFAGDGQSPWCTSMSHSQDDTTLLFNCYPLPSSTVMTAYLSSGLSDWQGNAAVPLTDQFTTTYYDSNTNGTVVTSRPGNAASGIAVNEPITLFFSLPINTAGASGGIEVAQNNVAVPGSVSVQDNGYTLVFTPSSNWVPGALIQWWTTGSLTDSTYNMPVTGASGYFYTAADTSTLAPALQVASPADTSIAAINSIVDLQFNVPLNPSTVNATNIYLYDPQTGLNVAGTYSMPQPNEVRIVPSANFTQGHTIFVFLTTGVQSTTSVPFGSNTWVTYFFANNPVDSTLPAVQSAVPFNGAGNVGVNVAPGFVFNKIIDPVSVNPNTFQVTKAGASLPGSFYLNSGDTRVQFVPNAPLPANTSLVMTLNGVLDQVGNPINFSSTFQTGPGPDFNAPYVLSTSIPVNGSVPTNMSVTIRFSESMDVTTFSTGPGGDIYIYDTLLGTPLPATLSWSADQSTAYLVPTSPLAAGREYYFYVNSGTDLAGNTVTSIEQTFYAEFAGASAAPTVINFNPTNGATGLGTNVVIEAQFSGPIDPNFLGNVTLTTGGSPVASSPSLSAGNTVLKLTPNVPLMPNTTYVMTIAGVKDPAANAVATVTDTFTTGPTYDITPASATNSDPTANSTVGTNVIPKLIFSKPLNPITVNNSTFSMYLVDTGQWIPLTVTLSPDGLEVTMTPQVPLQPSTRYYFQACCGYQDQDGNNGNSVTIYFWTNSGAVTTGPTVTVSPFNGQVGVPTNAQVIVTVPVPVDPTTVGQNAIQLLDPSNHPVAGTVSVPSVQQINFAPTSNLLPGSTYTVNINNFTDANGNPVVPLTTTFTTAAAAAAPGLTFSGANITSGATVTNNSQPIVLTFSQILDPATVNANTLKVMIGWNANYPIDGNYAVSGNQVTFTPTSPYPQGSQIYVGECGGPTDILGEVFLNGNCYGQQLVYFNVPSGSPTDQTPLTVLSVSPANGATNVRPDASISVTFNKSINPYSVYNNRNNALLFAGQGVYLAGSITMSADDRTLTFNTGVLSAGTTYTIQLPAGGISDPSGNSLAANFSSTFTAGSNPAAGNGYVVSTNPAFNASGVPTDNLLTLYVNRPVSASTLAGNVIVTVNGSVYAGALTAPADGYEVQFTPSTPFPNGATVQWWFSGVYDTYGNLFDGASGYFYTVAATNPTTDAPTVVAVSPGVSSSLMPTNGEIDIQYSLPIDATTVNTSNIYLNSGPSSPTFSVSLVSPTIVRITPNSPWNASTFYGFCTNSSVLGTNAVAATPKCWTTYFTTTAGTDTTAGAVTIGPPNGVVNVGTNAYIRLQFSKPVDRTSVNSTNVAVTAGGSPIPVTFGYNYSGADIYGINVSPVNPLPASTPIQVATSGLLDYAGNTFTPASSTFTTAAYPDYTIPTATTDFNYWQTGIATNAMFTCRYSEPMDPSSVSPGNTYLYSYVTNANVPVTYTWSTDLMSVTMTPTTPLLADAQYIYYCQGAIDLTGNGQQGNSAGFYTGNGPSSAGPQMLYVNPSNGMTNVPLNSNGGPWSSSTISLSFNEPVMADSTANITFTPNGGSPEPIGTAVEWGNTIVVVDLPWALVSNKTYTLNWAGVTDLNGNPASGATSSTFTTGSSFVWTNPTATASTPADGATGVAVTAPITLTFSTAMDPVLITSSQIYLRTHNTQTLVPTTLSISSSATATTPTTVTLTPTTPLDPSTIYDIVYWPNNWWLYDVAGNIENQNGVEATFTTGTAAAVNGACGSANGGSFSSPPPAANLCSAGNASAITNPGSWTWTCNGEYGGTNASCSASVAAGPACYAQPSGLVSWWKGNDDATDHMGNNDGTLENGASFALGEVGDAFTFNGNNQYVLIGQPVPADLQIQNNITLSAWVYMTSYPANGSFYTIVGSEDGYTTAGIAIYVEGGSNWSGIPPGSIDFDIGNGSSWYSAFTTTQIPLNQWVLVTAVASANQPDQIYYNGVLQPSFTPSNETVWNGTASYNGTWFAIGQTVSSNWPFNGLLDEVQVYNTALTAAQVNGIYNAGSTGVCP